MSHLNSSLGVGLKKNQTTQNIAEPRLVESPASLYYGQEMMWAYSTTLSSSHEAVLILTQLSSGY